MSKHLGDLRATLFDTLEKIKSGEIDLDRARAVNEVGKTLIDTAKVEVDYLRTVGGGDSPFIDSNQAAIEGGMPSGITSITRHILKG